MKRRNQYIYTIRQSLVTLTPFETLLLAAILLLSVASFVIKGEFGVNNLIACLSAILGVFCVVLGAKGSMANWIFGIAECLLYSYIAISGHIYGDALQRLFYTLPMQFVGWHLWSKRKRGNKAVQIKTRYMSWRTRGLYTAIIAALALGLGFFLKFAGPHLTSFFEYMRIDVQSDYANEAQLWLDASTTVMFLVAMFISTKAYVEQWYLWLVINVCSIVIWKFSPTEFSFMTVAKYSVYLVNTFYGMYMWHKLSA